MQRALLRTAAGWSGSVVEGCSPHRGLVTTQDVEGKGQREGVRFVGRGEAQREHVSKSSQAPQTCHWI